MTELDRIDQIAHDLLLDTDAGDDAHNLIGEIRGLVHKLNQRQEVVPHDTVVSLHNALNELLNLFIHAVGRDYNTVDDALKALAKSDISLPISMYFKNEIDELRDLSN